MALALTIVTAISSSMRQATLPFIVLIRQNINKLYEKKLKLLVYPVIVRVFLSFVIVLIFYSNGFAVFLEKVFPNMKEILPLCKILIWCLPVSVVDEFSSSILDSIRCKDLLVSISLNF